MDRKLLFEDSSFFGKKEVEEENTEDIENIKLEDYNNNNDNNNEISLKVRVEGNMYDIVSSGAEEIFSAVNQDYYIMYYLLL